MSGEEACGCGHLWTEHKRDEGCWHGWTHDEQGYVKVSGCECLLAHSRLSR